MSTEPKRRVSYKPKLDRTLALRVSDETLEELDVLCQNWRCSQGEAVRRLIQEAASKAKERKAKS